jgi:peptidase M23-like protein
VSSPRIRPNQASREPSPSPAGQARERRGGGQYCHRRADTWTCLKRALGEINWRCYIDNSAVNVGPGYAYLNRRREGQDGVDDIDFDWDVSKPMATATVKIRAHRWQAPPGTPVTLGGVGPAHGKWLVSSIDRSLFSTSADVELRFPEPDLPEPPPHDTGGTSDTSDDTGTRVTAKNVGTFIKSVNGTISAPFGDKCGHKGIHIAARTGTPIVASRAGTVPLAASQSGYGNVGVETRYADMSQVTCRRGLPINHGDKIGEVG